MASAMDDPRSGTKGITSTAPTPGVHAAVLSQIDPPDRGAGQLQRRSLDGLGRPEEAEDRTMMVGITIHVDEVGAAGANGLGEGPNHL